MKVSVLLTVFNCGNLLPRAIDSVLEQTYTDWDLTILDDGSTDPLVDECLAAIEGHEKVQIHRFTPTVDERRATVRYATNINFGATVSNGEVLSYLAGDDYYMPTRFERMIAKIKEGHHVVYGPQLLLNEYGVKLGLREAIGRLDDAFHRVDLNSVMHTRESFEKAGGWDDNPDFWTDADGEFWNRLCRAGYRFIPVEGSGDPTDAKHYRDTSVTMNMLAGRDPWHSTDTGRVVTDAPEWLVK